MSYAKKKAVSRAKHTLKSKAPTRYKKITRPPGVWICHAGKSSMQGMESRSLMIKQACMELDARGYTLREIAKAIKEKFGMEKELAPNTISVYLKAAREMLMKDIKDVQMVLRKDAFDELEPLRFKYLEITRAAAVCIKKTRVREGAREEYIDEDAFDKQIDALNGYLKIMAQQANLMGLNLKEAGHLSSEGNTPEDLTLWILNNIQQITAAGVPIGSGLNGFPMVDLDSSGTDADLLDAPAVLKR